MLTPDSIQEPPGNLVDPPIENPANLLLQPQPATQLVQPFHPELYNGTKPPLNNPDGWQLGRPVPFSPPGLESLIQIDQILVQQKACDMSNKYQIGNIKGQNLFTAIEDTTFCSMFCGGPLHTKITDSEEREVINLHRQMPCENCCFPGCLHDMQVTASGVVCGFIKQTWHLWKPKFKVCDSSGETVLRIVGPGITCTFCRDVKFEVLTRDGKSEIGCITRKLSGLSELCNDINQYCISFPMDLDAKIKAVLLGACLLIDSIYLIF